MYVQNVIAELYRVTKFKSRQLETFLSTVVQHRARDWGEGTVQSHLPWKDLKTISALAMKSQLYFNA